jgi:hypothetical protein
VNPASKRPKVELNLLDRLHGSDPLSLFRDLDQWMQATDFVSNSKVYLHET